MIKEYDLSEILIARNYLKKYCKSHPSVLSTFDRMSKILINVDQVDLKKYLKAVCFAAKKHQGQKRNQNETVPYIVHPMRVAALLIEIGNIKDENYLIAALLHDTLEDTDTSIEELENSFGKEILKLVEELTEKPNLNMEEELKHAKKMSKHAKTIKLADRTHNLQDLLDHPPEIWNKIKLQSFLLRSENLLQALINTHLKLEKAFTAALKNLIEKIK